MLDDWLLTQTNVRLLPLHRLSQAGLEYLGAVINKQHKKGKVQTSPFVKVRLQEENIMMEFATYSYLSSVLNLLHSFSFSSLFSFRAFLLPPALL